ncbi:ATP-binding cassette domain-containing protein [Clostridium sp.]|uniref:ATP-binding cassette domain-containing protein n=1 Tax=Clostridium sp. TaxID=1506 RepID=UPI002FC61526
MEEVILRLNKLSKKYDSNYVLKNINLEVKKGSIHGIVGANGSGKSTLFNILSGSEVISQTGGYEGYIEVNGRKRGIHRVNESRDLGIGIIHQELALFSDMRVFENIMLTCEKTTSHLKAIIPDNIRYLDNRENKRITANLLNEMGIEVDSSDVVEDLSLNTRQFLEIAREINRDNLKLLLLDEPTAALSHEDATRLIKVLRDMANRGITIIFVSHRLEEVTSICDRVTVMRDGEIVSSYEKEEFNIEKIALDMIGYKVTKTNRKSVDKSNNIAIEFKDYSVLGEGENIKGFNLSVCTGGIRTKAFKW